MPIQNIHNIDLSKIDSQAVFFLDTNILYFIHSGYYAPTKTECVIYSSFVQHLLTKNMCIYFKHSGIIIWNRKQRILFIS